MKVFALFFSFSFFALSLTGQNDVSKDVEKLSLFLNSLNERYVDSVETSTLLEKGIRSMLEELDPHSVYMNPSQYIAATEPLKGNFKGVGIRYQIILDTMTVLEVMPSSPSERGGIKRGDQFIAIGKDTIAGKKLSSGEMSRFLKSDENMNEPVSIFRNGGKERLEIVLERDNIKVSSVPAAFLLEDHIGYIKFSRFSSTSLTDFRAEMDKLRSSGMKHLVFDLRGNSGGYLNVAVKILDEFIPDRRLLVYTEGTHQSRKETFSTSGGRFTRGDLVVLIDENSASASEVVAGALQDLDRALIMGRRSYGKGLVQRTVEFDDGSAMRMTISRYYTPTGRSIQRPYDEGLKAYKSEGRKRKESGELYSADSIEINDSLVYYTPARRKVYGGGGIIPDVFVPTDSSKSSPFMRSLVKSGLHVRTALDYVDSHSDELSIYPSVQGYTSKFIVPETLLNEVRMAASKRGDICSDEEFEAAKIDLNEVMKTLIARFYFGYEDHFYVIASYDEMIHKAIDDIQNDTFKELGLK